MSLLFDHAISEFEPNSSVHYTPTGNDLNSTGETLPIEPIARFATYHEELKIEDYTCLPLHYPDRAELSGEYLAYAEDNLRGEIIIFIDKDGNRDSIGLDEFSGTYLAQRLRFWHSDYQPETYPPTYDRPVDDREEPRDTIPPEKLLDGLKEHVTGEQRAALATARERLDGAPPAEQVEDGGAVIPTLTYQGEEGGCTHFRAEPEPDHAGETRDWSYYIPDTFNIHQDAIVALQDKDGEILLEGEVVNITGLSISVDFDWGAVNSEAALRSQLSRGKFECGLSLLLNPVPFQRDQEAIEKLEKHRLLDVLAGQQALTFTNGVAGQSEPQDTALNQEQELAVELSLLADDLFCIHGPPGTGKTRTLIEIIRRAVQAGERVLVCADSNQAVDNLVVGDSTNDDPSADSLHAFGQHGENEFVLNRVNARRSAHKLVRSNYNGDINGADVVATTNNSAAKLGSGFDLLVLDEATQSTCTASCIPLTKANRVVLAGDHKQLPPFSSQEEPPESTFGLSLFEHLYADGGLFENVGIQLKTQYRMHRDIAYFPNRVFYNKELRTGRSRNSLAEKNQALEAYNVGGEVSLVDNSYANRTEARLVTYLITELLETISPREIGVITPYSAQVEMIRELLDEHIEHGAKITVDTIDAFQGSEREAILLSLVRSNPTGSIGFLGRQPDGPRRLNVALTRAKRYCGIVGDLHTFRYESEDKTTDLYTEFYGHLNSTGRVSHVDPSFIPVK